jgi:hypothetical protein
MPKSCAERSIYGECGVNTTASVTGCRTAVIGAKPTAERHELEPPLLWYDRTFGPVPSVRV